MAPADAEELVGGAVAEAAGGLGPLVQRLWEEATSQVAGQCKAILQVRLVVVLCVFFFALGVCLVCALCVCLSVCLCSVLFICVCYVFVSSVCVSVCVSLRLFLFGVPVPARHARAYNAILSPC